VYNIIKMLKYYVVCTIKYNTFDVSICRAFCVCVYGCMYSLLLLCVFLWPHVQSVIDVTVLVCCVLFSSGVATCSTVNCTSKHCCYITHNRAFGLLQ
jgi:hypothetical protein